MSERCSKTVYGGGRLFSGSPCSKPVAGTENGKPWCTIHLPSRVKERDRKRDEKWAAERKVRNAAYARENRYREVCREMAKLLWDRTPIGPGSALANEFLTYFPEVKR